MCMRQAAKTADVKGNYVHVLALYNASIHKSIFSPQNFQSLHRIQETKSHTHQQCTCYRRLIFIVVYMITYDKEES